MSHSEVNLGPAQSSSAEMLEAEYRALTERAGFRMLDDRTVVRVSGDDRLAFFHGICSADVKGAKPGDVLPALFLTEHAHIIGEFFLWIEDQALILETETASWPREKEHLEKLLVADDVEMEELPAMTVLHLEGPDAADALALCEIAGAHALKPWSCSKSINAILGRVPRFGADAFELLGPRPGLSELADRLQRSGAMRVSEGALAIVRVEHGLAQAGIDTNEKTIALEARLNRAISLNKGCYLGQETIERATSRGGLKKRLFALRFNKPVASGAALFLDGKEVGRVTSGMVSPRLGAIGLSILHHSAWNPGTVLDARGSDGEARAIVSEIPLRDG